MSLSPIGAAVQAQSKSLLEHAVAYATRGWSIIAVNGKRPAGMWKPFQSEPADHRTLRRLFAKKNVTGIAVITGAVSGGLAVRDFDQADAYHAWSKDHPDVAKIQPTVKTARGFHVFGTLNDEAFADLGDGELRADSGHYTVIPPSVHPTGAVYTWIVPLPVGPLPSLPGSLTQIQKTQSDSSTPKTYIACWTSAIAATLPSGPGQRNRCIFKFARHLKAIMPDATPTELRSALKEWHRQGLPFICTKDFGESWSDFAVAWGRVRRPSGQSFATAAARAAELPPFVEQIGYDGPLRQLAALCWQLAQQWKDTPFPLGCEIAARYLGVSTRHAGRLLKTLQFDGVLKLAFKGTKGSGKASEWRFNEE